jgi:SET domain-containing protein
MARRKPSQPKTQEVTPQISEKHSCFRLEIKPSTIHRWGIYAGENIPARRKVIEYTGERISRRETKRRADETPNLIYLFTLDSYWTLDGSVGGSGAQYINHCCDPNIMTVIRNGHILYMSCKPIKKGEELTVDYHFAKNVEQVPCRCGSLRCRGTINVK